MEILKKFYRFLRHLYWQEQAQLRETSRVFVLAIGSVAIVIMLFGLVFFFLERAIGEQRTLVECLYFTWITFAGIGYSNEGFYQNDLVRLVTILAGVYLITRFIVLSANIYARTVVEQVREIKLDQEMRKTLEKVQGHFLVFGDDRELLDNIVHGLIDRHQVFLVGDNRELLKDYHKRYPELKFIVAKPHSAETMELVRPQAAQAAYLLFREDERNLLLGAMLEGRVRVISTFSGDFSVIHRFRRVGVEPISPHFSGGLKIVSTLVRPQATAFLDRFVFPDQSVLEFRRVAPARAQEDPLLVPIGALAGGELHCGAAPTEGQELLALGFRDPARRERELGRLELPALPHRTDRFLVLGGGIIGSAVLSELLETCREAVVIDPDRSKLAALRQRFGDRGITCLQGAGLPGEYEQERFDGVAIATPVDQRNFAIGLDFIGSELLRVARAVDGDMEQHYLRIGALPVFIGRVGANRMLREVTNKYANKVLRMMLEQGFRMDQVCLSGPATVGELRQEFGAEPVALVRERVCRFGLAPEEELRRDDTLIVFGGIEQNKRLRLAHCRLVEAVSGERSDGRND